MNSSIQQQLTDAYAGFQHGDLSRILDLLNEEVTWQVGGPSPLAGTYAGKAQVLGFFGKMVDLYEGSLQLQTRAVLADDGDGVVVTAERAVRRRRARLHLGARVPLRRSRHVCAVHRADRRRVPRLLGAARGTPVETVSRRDGRPHTIQRSPIDVNDLISADVRRFFIEFERTSNELDLPASAAQFTDPFLTADPNRVAVVPKAAFLNALPSRAELFASIGRVGSHLLRLTETRLDDLHVLVDTEWETQLRDDTGRVDTLALSSVFILRRDNGTLRIVFYLNRDDIVAVIQGRRAGSASGHPIKGRRRDCRD
ncbi:MAG: nuclear transport factor 2 family protein [Actinomycetota bacterium]|nr:nuclear transport factor 2 family protein [Actinomycetota bacterium]